MLLLRTREQLRKKRGKERKIEKDGEMAGGNEKDREGHISFV